MIVTVTALVLSTLPYSESSLILRAYTREAGLQSFILKGVKGKNSRQKAGILRPLHSIEITYYKSQKTQLHLVKEYRLYKASQTIAGNHKKTAIVLFLAEVLQKVVKEEEKNEVLYTFIDVSLDWLDTAEDYMNFHLIFLSNLCRYLGFQPLNNFSSAHAVFDLSAGQFVEPGKGQSPAVSEGSMLSAFFSDTSYQRAALSAIDNETRRMLLRDLVSYYSLHSAGFGQLKSLEVLETVFSG